MSNFADGLAGCGGLSLGQVHHVSADMARSRHTRFLVSRSLSGDTGLREFFTGIGRVATGLSPVFRILTGAGLARGPDFPVFPGMFSAYTFLKGLILS